MRTSLFATLLTLAASLPAFAGNDGFTLSTIPPGQTLYARADTLEALTESTDPDLTFILPSKDDAADETVLLWTGKTADGNRHFSLATVYTLEPKGGTPSCVIFNPSKSAADIYPRLTAATATKGDPNEPVLAKSGTQSLSAIVASVHPQNGTLYQLSFDRLLGQRATHDERRLFVMHDPDHGWRFVGQLPGNYRTDFDSGALYHEARTVRTTIAWTSVPEAPVRIHADLAVEIQHTPTDGSRKIPLTKISGSYTLGGTLPLRPLNPHYELTIQKGHTFTGLGEILYSWYSYNNPESNTTSADMRRAILALNPTLSPNTLRIGEPLAIPDIHSLLPVGRQPHYVSGF